MPADFKKITDKVKEAMVNPELDGTAASLRRAREELKDVPGNSDLVARIMERVKGSLDQDLTELNIPEEQKSQLATAFETRFKVATTGLERDAIFRSVEGERLNAFINDFAKYTRLDAVIEDGRKRDSKDPMKRLVRTMRAATPLFVGIGAGITRWLNDGKKPGQEGSETPQLQVAAARADAVLTGNQGKKDDQPKTAPTPAPATSAPSPSPVSGGSRVESRGTAKYEINPDNSKKLSPEEFRKRYESITDRHARHMFVLQQVATGNANNAFERLNIAGKNGSDLELELEVEQGPITVAGMEVQFDGPTALAAVQLRGCVLPTQWVIDRTYQQAKASHGMVAFVDYDQITRALNIPEGEAYTYTEENGQRVKHPNGTLMMSARYAAKRDELVKEWCARNHISQDQLRAGHFKEIIHPSAKRAAGRLSIYGGVDKNGKIIQDGEGPHEASYSDYSGLARGVREKVWIKNKKTGERKQMTFAEFSSNPQYAREFGFEAPRAGQAYSYNNHLQRFVDEHSNTNKTTPRPKQS